jgi:hypothetical protein
MDWEAVRQLATDFNVHRDEKFSGEAVDAPENLPGDGFAEYSAALKRAIVEKMN